MRKIGPQIVLVACGLKQESTVLASWMMSTALMPKMISKAFFEYQFLN